LLSPIRRRWPFGIGVLLVLLGAELPLGHWQLPSACSAAGESYYSGEVRSYQSLDLLGLIETGALFATSIAHPGR
jgi:hypothetical protein